MGYEIYALVAGLIIGSVVAYAISSSGVGLIASEKAREIALEMFQAQKDQLEQSISQTYQARLDEWKATELAEAIKTHRLDAVNTSRAVLKGKIAEQMAPFLGEFLEKFNPADARFIGSPIDYLIFNGMSEGADSDEPIEVVLLDVKTGKANLNKIQRKIEEAVIDKRVRFDTLRIMDATDASTPVQGTSESGIA
jgi:predicted Holliday junction resolvase-like endonuclease